MTIRICDKCDGVIEPTVLHDCIRGLTDNINRLHHNLDMLIAQMLKRRNHDYI